METFLPTENHYLFGLTAIKMRQGFSSFSLALQIIPQNVMKIQIGQPIEYLQISYFGITPKISNICSKALGNSCGNLIVQD